VTKVKRGRGRPPARHPVIPVTVRLPERTYDLYCLEAVLTMEKVATIFRRILVRHASLNFRNPKNLRRRRSAQTSSRAFHI